MNSLHSRVAEKAYDFSAALRGGGDLKYIVTTGLVDLARPLEKRIEAPFEKADLEELKKELPSIVEYANAVFGVQLRAENITISNLPYSVRTTGVVGRATGKNSIEISPRFVNPIEKVPYPAEERLRAARIGVLAHEVCELAIMNSGSWLSGMDAKLQRAINLSAPRAIEAAEEFMAIDLKRIADENFGTYTKTVYPPTTQPVLRRLFGAHRLEYHPESGWSRKGFGELVQEKLEEKLSWYNRGAGDDESVVKHERKEIVSDLLENYSRSEETVTVKVIQLAQGSESTVREGRSTSSIGTRGIETTRTFSVWRKNARYKDDYGGVYREFEWNGTNVGGTFELLQKPYKLAGIDDSMELLSVNTQSWLDGVLRPVKELHYWMRERSIASSYKEGICEAFNLLGIRRKGYDLYGKEIRDDSFANWMPAEFVFGSSARYSTGLAFFAPLIEDKSEENVAKVLRRALFDRNAYEQMFRKPKIEADRVYWSHLNGYS